ncbi:hypothetical protein E1287_05290 [Actinomadura sp. KC06]|uniref:hypothetical protein n=1 Tax=Actinomadura sp. KC06 TaxID=2530369 RepID=UPI00105061DD|nr:hypothetical protein [Actinomadura sp. KC06]TDD38694.1 hypothetical protein E1287_05290 [Actinomadura sp. KC06]
MARRPLYASTRYPLGAVTGRIRTGSCAGPGDPGGALPIRTDGQAQGSSTTQHGDPDTFRYRVHANSGSGGYTVGSGKP